MRNKERRKQKNKSFSRKGKNNSCMIHFLAPALALALAHVLLLKCEKGFF